MKPKNETLRKVSQIAPQPCNRIEGLLQSAAVAMEHNELEQAYEIYKSVLKREPKNLQALLGYAQIALQWGLYSAAADSLNSVLAVNTNHVAANNTLALVYTRMQRYDDAIVHYRKVLAMQPENAAVHGELARLYTLTGDIENARKRYRNAFELNPEDPRNIHGLVQTDENAITPQIVDTIESLLTRNDLPLQDRSSFYFALGAIHDREARYDEAFANYTVANIARGEHYDAVAQQQLTDDLIATFSESLFERHNNVRVVDAGESPMPAPVFIVGMPRSGTTLVEQILATHDDIHAAGELDRMARISRSLSAMPDNEIPYPSCVEKLSSSSLYQAARSHRKYLKQLCPTNSRLITDKMPANYLHIGLIALLFPDAKIIHCQRDPLDVCLSCFFQNFSGNHAYASDLQNLGHYYNQYQRLMQHWRRVLPLQILDVSYEQLVSDTEVQSRRMLDYLQLQWQPQCLKFHHHRRAVNTASLVQVRKPVYSSSIGRWRNYDKYLHGLKKSLGCSDITDEVNNIMATAAHNELPDALLYGEKSCS